MRARYAAVVGAALLAIAGCSSTATADDEPTTPTPTPTATETADEPTEEPTEEPTQDATDAPYVDPDGNPMTEEDVDYMYDGDLGWGETYGLLDLMWTDLTVEQRDELCGTRYEIGDDETYTMLNDALQENEDWNLDRYAVYDFLNDYC